MTKCFGAFEETFFLISGCTQKSNFGMEYDQLVYAGQNCHIDYKKQAKKLGRKVIKRTG